MAATPRWLLKNAPPGLAEARPTSLHTDYQRRAVPVRTDLHRTRRRQRSTARCRAARFPGFGTEIADSRAVSLGSGGTRHGSFTIEEFREGMRRRRRLRSGLRHKIGSVSQHILKLRKNHMVQAWVLGLSWMTGPVEQVRWIDASQPVELCLQPESLILAQNERWRHA